MTDALRTAAFPRSSPESQGVASGGILRFVDAATAAGFDLHSLMILRYGHVIAEGWWAPYTRDGLQLLYSVSKSFTSTALGLAVSESRLSVDDRIVDFFPGSVPADVSEHVLAMTVRHVLTMGTGHLEDSLERAFMADDKDLIRGFLSVPPDEAPGSVFAYNNGATHVLAAIVHRVTGLGVIDYLRPRLLDPLGIQDARWDLAPSGIELGFSGLHVTTESIAKLGQLYLQRGQWQGRQLLTESWVRDATSTQIVNDNQDNVDWQQGYGYQFWRSRHDSYRADGAYGQFCLVLPHQDAVVVTTAACPDLQGLLDLAWAHLLPAFESTVVAAAPPEERALATRLETAQIPPVQGSPTPGAGVEVTGRVLAPAPSNWEPAPGFLTLPLTVGLERDDEGWLLTSTDADGRQTFRCGLGEWQSNTVPAAEVDRRAVYASGAWTLPDVFAAELVYVATPHRMRITCRFGPGEPTFEAGWTNADPL